MTKQSVLATDMDGTFIPLDGNEQNRRDLRSLTELINKRQIQIVYVTGRHFEIVLDVIRTAQLPTPDWIICDVGTSIYQRSADGQHEVLQSYVDHLSQIVATCCVTTLQNQLTGVVGLRLQEPEKQGDFKLSYYCDALQLKAVEQAVLDLLQPKQLPYHVIASIDPFTGDGLIDLLPAGVSKAYALRWWSAHRGLRSDSIIFAGDSGNDLAALTDGYRSIVVGNASADLRQQVSQVHAESGWTDRLFEATRDATSGVLDGVEYFTN